jgi:DNA-binding MarR family transcriptional regulator
MMPTQNQKPTTHAADRIAGECLARRVRLLNRTITGIYDDSLRPMGLTSGQLSLLVVVAKRGPLSPGEVAKRMNMEKSTVSRNLDRMRQNGWVRVRQSDAGRKHEVTLTRSGRDLIQKCLPAWDEAQTRARAMLGRGGVESIHRLSNTVWSRLASR